MKVISDGSATAVAYGASKHGVIGIMRAFAVELAPHSIRVNSIHPTGVATPMVQNADTKAWIDSNADALASSLQNLLPVELIEPSDVSDAILWLVSDAARYITGVMLPVDAGFTAL
jgi:NAD(P)-dependent dehydrogenase (short-subunit alcohol dehydrogenase family)